MKGRVTSATITTEFGHEFEAERQAWLRRRFTWYVGFNIVFGILGVLILVFRSPPGTVLEYTVQGISLTAYLTAFTYVWRNADPRVPILRIVYWLILGLGTLILITGPIIVSRTADQISRGSDQRVVQEERPAARTPPTTPDETIHPAAPLAETPTQASSSPAAEVPGPVAESSHIARANAVRMIMSGFVGVWTIFISHFLACVFLPWTARESLRPIIPLLVINAVLTSGSILYAAAAGNWSWKIGAAGVGLLALSLIMPLPGMAVCWWRHSRFRHQFTFDVLRGRYTELRQELVNARQIHESLFPMPMKSGPVRFEYVYEPMRQIGGDYLHACVCPRTPLRDGQPQSGQAAYNFAIVDVTGHGIPAALTVNRLHGELARIFAESPQATPGEVLRLLNSYVHLTLATHSVYVTAICIRIDPAADTLEYASGGHPPAFVRTVDGRVEELPSTSFVLGACAGPDFQPEPRTLRFSSGDVLIAYTDGATEARDPHGRYFSIRGIQQIIASGTPKLDGGWAAAILEHVERHRYGPTADDILIIEVRRPVEIDLSKSGIAPRFAGSAQESD